MSNFFRLTATGLVVLSSFLATSCKEEEEETHDKTPDNFYTGECSLNAMGSTVSYGNTVRILENGKVAVIDSISYGPFNAKKFEIRNLIPSKDKEGWNIKVDETRLDTIENSGYKFIVLSGNGSINKTEGTFKFNILPVGMPSKTGFEFTLTGKKTLFDE